MSNSLSTTSGLFPTDLAAIDLGTAMAVAEPVDPRPGAWVGAPSALCADGAVHLAYRLRRPVGRGRGIANVVARSEDGVHFRTVAVVHRDRVDGGLPFVDRRSRHEPGPCDRARPSNDPVRCRAAGPPWPEGGYALARPANQIAMADIIRAVEGSLATVRDTSPADLDYEGPPTTPGMSCR